MRLALGIIVGMKTPLFSLGKDDILLSDPEVLADRLAEFLRRNVEPADRDLIVMFVDRLLLGLCDDFEDEELMRGAQVKFAALSQEEVDSLRAMQTRADENRPEAVAARAKC